jgi:hypothetical protein
MKAAGPGPRPYHKEGWALGGEDYQGDRARFERREEMFSCFEKRRQIQMRTSLPLVLFSD